jgi:hypothetical protein
LTNNCKGNIHISYQFYYNINYELLHIPEINDRFDSLMFDDQKDRIMDVGTIILPIVAGAFMGAGATIAAHRYKSVQDLDRVEEACHRLYVLHANVTAGITPPEQCTKASEELRTMAADLQAVVTRVSRSWIGRLVTSAKRRTRLRIDACPGLIGWTNTIRSSDDRTEPHKKRVRKGLALD